MPAIARAGNNVRKLTPDSGSSCSSLSGSTRDLPTNAAIHAPALRALSVMNPVLGNLHRRAHRTAGIKVKHKPLPLHSIAPRHCWRTAMGSVDRMYRASPRPLSSSAHQTFWRANLPRVESVMRVKCRFTLRSSAKSSSPKNAGLYSAENLCRVRPTTNHRISR